MSSLEDELGLGLPLGRLMNQAALMDFMTIEVAGMTPDESIGAEGRDALVAVLEASAMMSRELVKAFESADRERHAAKESAE